MAVRSQIIDCERRRRGPAARPGAPCRATWSPARDYEYEIELRRPLGAARLRIEPVVADRGAAAELGGPVWDSAI